MCNVYDFKMDLSARHWDILRNELDSWHTCYPTGKVAVDIGAGCGETVQFFLNHGAERVLAIEGNPENVKHLTENFQHDPRVTIFPYMIDAIKIDIDGAEKGMAVETPYGISRQWTNGRESIFRVGDYYKHNGLLEYFRYLPGRAVIHYRNVIRGLIP